MPRTTGEYSLAIVEFALTFDGYAHYPAPTVLKFAEKAQLRYAADGTLPRSLDRLRACLFVQQRGWRETGDPDAKSLLFIMALVDRMRQLVQRRAGSA